MRRPAASPSPEAPAVKGLTWAGIRYGLNRIAKERSEWCGIPTPLSDMRLTIEPKNPHAELFQKLPGQATPPEANFKLVNRWWSPRKGGDVVIWRDSDGRLDWGVLRSPRAAMEFDTLKCVEAWSLESEIKACGKLRELIPRHLWEGYMIAGIFPQTSKRSGVSYLFRKLRPTLALRPTKNGEDMRILAALCMHPIGYFAGTWAGAMTPTDDVIAHLMLMRGDEHMFWRRCNQHPAYRPEAGL